MKITQETSHANVIQTKFSHLLESGVGMSIEDSNWKPLVKSQPVETEITSCRITHPLKTTTHYTTTQVANYRHSWSSITCTYVNPSNQCLVLQVFSVCPGFAVSTKKLAELLFLVVFLVYHE